MENKLKGLISLHDRFLCPTCGAPLTRGPRDYRCAQNHLFDLSRSGYVNLLTAGSKHSKVPGDNKLMVNARRSFLDKGYYSKLCELVSLRAAVLAGDGPVLDAGCGEGYYTTAVFEALARSGRQVDVMGIDISKIALDKAAKRCKEIAWAVGSVFHLPVGTESCGLLLNLFAPYCGEEYHRVLAPDGKMLLVIPGKDHLWELKKAVYEHPYRNEVKDFALEGFELLRAEHCADTLFLDNAEDIDHLFKMTPYYYKTSEQDYKRLAALSELTTRIEFNVLEYQKKGKGML